MNGSIFFKNYTNQSSKLPLYNQILERLKQAHHNLTIKTSIGSRLNPTT